jgi:ApbE superfamily uncharacterized protein (UPF0280 family)
MQAAILPGGRLHLNDGPIDLVIGADGDPANVRRAYATASARFASALDELCEELSLLRHAMTPQGPAPARAIARRMDRATRPLCADRFLTRMAAVAGAVADEILTAMIAAPLRRAYVNNGGDIALHLAPGESFSIGLVDRPDAPRLFGDARISFDDDIRGVATSGWRGRSFSLGIADAVTILARDAACADAAATLVANAVDLPDHPGIVRVPARDLDPQSDLGSRLVTRGVGALSQHEIARALGSGAVEAERLVGCGAIAAAALHLGGATRIVGRIPLANIATKRGLNRGTGA